MPRIFLAAALMCLGCALIRPCSASPDSVVVFHEIHYNPPASSESGEWIELFNQMGIKVDVSGWKIEGVGYTFPKGTIINPGAYLVVAKTPGVGQLGPFSGNIDNGGERLRLINHSDRMMDEVNFDDNAPWPVAADGAGCTLAKSRPYTASGPPANWEASSQVGGTPGNMNFPSPPATVGLRFNEIQAVSAAGFWLELTNTGTSSMDVGGVVISAGGDPLKEHVLPAGTLAPGGILLLDEAALGFRPVSGDKLFLFNSTKSAVFDAREATNRLRGRAAERNGAWLYPAAATPGAANSFDFSSAVVISEIQYNPPVLPATPAVPATYQTLPLIGFNDVWRYNSSNESLPTDWAGAAHALGGNWTSGAGPIGREESGLPVPIVTPLPNYSPGTVTCYFEREFTLSAAQLAALESLQIVHLIDDGAVFYVNGIELSRFNLNAGTVGPETQASVGVGNAALVTSTVSPAGLIVGSNRISVEVHQYGTGSTDFVFGLKLDARLIEAPAVAGRPLRDSDNQWLEIANRTPNPVDLTGWRLEDGVDFSFAAGTTLAPGEHACIARDAALFAAAYPGARLLGTFTGSLARSGERLVLSDAIPESRG